MNPIPLRHQRRVYAYACGRCHQVYDGGSIKIISAGYFEYTQIDLLADDCDHAARVSS